MNDKNKETPIDLGWEFEKNVVRQKDKQGLIKAKELEQRKVNAHWRYVSVDDRTKILVPCDKKGVPTKEGKKRIETYRQNRGIKN